MSSETTLIRL